MRTPKALELSSFETIKDNSSCNLSWMATNEGVNSYFDIQRSNDGISFTDLGRIYAGNHNPNSTLFSFVDLKPSPGVNNYRLKIVDRNGLCCYSAIRTLTFGF